MQMAYGSSATERLPKICWDWSCLPACRFPLCSPPSQRDTGPHSASASPRGTGRGSCHKPYGSFSVPRRHLSLWSRPDFPARVSCQESSPEAHGSDRASHFPLACVSSLLSGNRPDSGKVPPDEAAVFQWSADPPSHKVPGKPPAGVRFPG